jgi:uncharacterized damage-inducible protein DinB
MKKFSKPDKNEYASFYGTYIDKLSDESYDLNFLVNQSQELMDIFSKLSDEQANFSYGEGKWSLKEVLGHLIDHERIFCYRALAIARGERQSLPGFEQDDYVKTAEFNQQKLSDLVEQYSINRSATISLFKNFTEGELHKVGMADNKNISVRALLFIIMGHEKHHIWIIKERYLIKLRKIK